MTTPAAARKGRFGARVYPIPNADGEIVNLTAVSNVLKVLAAPGLEIWKQGILAEQFALRNDLVLLAANPATRREAIYQALNSNKSAANTGTALHHFTEAVDDDTVMWEMIPDSAKPLIRFYAQAKERWGWRLVEKEVTVFSHEMGYAGTADRFMELPGEGVVTMDVKSGKNVYADTALQLSLYANAEGIWTPPDLVAVEAELQPLHDKLAAVVACGVNPENGRKMSQAYQDRQEALIDQRRWEVFGQLGTKRPMPEGLRRDKGFVIHLTEEGCELVPMNLNGTLEVVRGLCAVVGFQARKDVLGKPQSALAEPVVVPEPEPEEEDEPLDPMEPTGAVPVSTPPSPEVHFATLRARLMALGPETQARVAFDWPEGTPGLKILDHTAEQLQAIDALLWDVECKAVVLAEETAAIVLLQQAFSEEPF